MINLLRQMRFAPLVFLLTIPAWGDVIYTNGAINGTINAWDIFPSWAVSDSFVVSSDSTITDLSNVGIWVNSGDTLATLNWTISTAPDDGGTIEASATNAAPSTSSLFLAGTFGAFDVYNVSFSVPSVSLAAGTYYLTFENGMATLAGANSVYWDENDGPSSATQYLSGALQNTPGSQAFEVDGTSSAPEPSALLLLGSGLGALAIARRK